MYCSNCGKKWKENDKFCGGCGSPRGQESTQITPAVVINNAPSVPVQTSVPPKKGMPVWGIVLIIVLSVLGIGFLGLVLLFTIIFSVASDISYDYSDAQTYSYVYVDEDEIPTIYHLIGEYEMCGYPEYVYEEEYESVTYSYCDSYFDEDVMQEYLDYLVDDYGFEEYDVDSMYRSVKIDSIDDGYIIVVKAYLYGESIEYYKVEEDEDYVDNTV